MAQKKLETKVKFTADIKAMFIEKSSKSNKERARIALEKMELETNRFRAENEPEGYEFYKFLLNYAAQKQGAIGKVNGDIVSYYNNLVENSSAEILIKEMKSCLNAWVKLLSVEECKTAALIKGIKVLDDLGNTGFLSLLLYASTRFDINNTDFLEIADALLVWFIRYLLNGFDNGQRSNSETEALISDTWKRINTGKTANEIVLGIKNCCYVKDKTSIKTYIDDESFKECLARFEINYDRDNKTDDRKKKIIILLLMRIETSLNSDSSFVFEHYKPENKTEGLTIEHIIPRKVYKGGENIPYPKWAVVEKDKNNEPSKDDIHSLGNLVLLTGAQNGELENFDRSPNATQKVKWERYKNGFDDANLGKPAEHFKLIEKLLNDYPINQPFGKAEIAERQEMLADYAVKYCRID